MQRISNAGGVTNVLVDTSPDLREQALDAGFGTLDGVLFTHPHADHIHGIDDLRGFVMNMRRRVDVYADRLTIERLKAGFGYCFETPPGSEYPPIANAHTIEAGRPVTIEGQGGALTALPVSQIHGSITSLAFRVGGLAYSPDASGFDETAEALLKNLDVWIVDALRPRPHPSHLSLSEALEWIDCLKPKRAILTHMHVDLDYETLRRELPEGVEPAYDGMVIELPA
jgi:phosphoribosyl 1,2-cyclic phosphate phosphodiesterase